MPYATEQQLVDRFGEGRIIALTDRGVVPMGVIDTAVLARALADSDAMIDGYLAGRYALPLASTPPLVADIAQAIALWKLHTTEPEAKVKADYDAAVRTLREIAQGIVQLSVAGLEPAASGNSGVQITDRTREFTADNMRGFI